jgi:hypothetical protein
VACASSTGASCRSTCCTSAARPPRPARASAGLVAKIPARRLPAAIAALAALVARERRPGEAAADVLHRQDDAALDAALAGLGELTAADATAADFVDLDDGETRHVAAA